MLSSLVWWGKRGPQVRFVRWEMNKENIKVMKKISSHHQMEDLLCNVSVMMKLCSIRKDDKSEEATEKEVMFVRGEDVSADLKDGWRRDVRRWDEDEAREDGKG